MRYAVSTVHKAKGLEYPSVFVVDVEAQRFPGRARPYDGWLPPAVIAAALKPWPPIRRIGARKRDFSISAINACRTLSACYGSSENLPAVHGRVKPTEFSRRLAHLGDIRRCECSPTLPGRAGPCPRASDESMRPSCRRAFSEISLLTMRCPMDYRFRHGFGFTPPVPDMFAVARRCTRRWKSYTKSIPTERPLLIQAAEVARRVFHLKHVPQSRDPQNQSWPIRTSPRQIRRHRQELCAVLYPRFSAPTTSRKLASRSRRETVSSAGSIDLTSETGRGGTYPEKPKWSISKRSKAESSRSGMRTRLDRAVSAGAALCKGGAGGAWGDGPHRFVHLLKGRPTRFRPG